MQCEMKKSLRRTIMIFLTAVCLWACSPTRHVAPGDYLLDEVNILVDDSAGLDRSELINYVRQVPNHKVLGFAKLQLGIYNMSGKDSTRWYNRWLRRLGQPPVVYDPMLMERSERQLCQALINKGYMDARVQAIATPDSGSRKMRVDYALTPGKAHTIRSLGYEIADTAIGRIVMADSADMLLSAGDRFDRNALDQERTRLTRRLREEGYYGFAKEYISFVADTAEESLDVDLTMVIRPPHASAGGDESRESAHRRFAINKVTFVAGNTHTSRLSELAADGGGLDSVAYKGINVIYQNDDRYILPSALEEKCFLYPGMSYSPSAVDRTYEALTQLGIVKSVNIEMVPVATVDGVERLDAYILLTRNKKQGITLELEGTNSEGDFGFGVGVAYQHRDLARRSNLLTTKFRVNYESLSGNLSNLINDRYTEYAGEVGLTFPKFMMPFLSKRFKQRSKASTELATSFNYQERPEYTRVIAGAAWKYKWATPDNRVRRTWDLVDINYVYLPESTIDFINQIAPSNPLLRYSYEDHFIMRMAYTLHLTNKRIAAATIGSREIQPRVFTLRASAETAGNLLYAISSLSGQHRDDGVYKLFGIQYSQYAKAEADYALTLNLNRRHALAFHAGFGIGVPYGNSRVLPFEKRFYAGGANGVRGWGVRTLGPGSFDSRNSVTDFINQCGDIRLDLSLEYRAKLFWVFEGAAFVDAGNVWTIHSYENQPGGLFRFSTFWKQIAAAYGVGIRMDFNYFLLRFDLGIKAYNPAMNQERWPLIHPRWKRDTAFHFSVGYPF